MVTTFFFQSVNDFQQNVVITGICVDLLKHECYKTGLDLVGCAVYNSSIVYQHMHTKVKGAVGKKPNVNIFFNLALELAVNKYLFRIAVLAHIPNIASCYVQNTQKLQMQLSDQPMLCVIERTPV